MKQNTIEIIKKFHICDVKSMEEKIEIMNLLQKKQLFEKELTSLAYGAVEIRENNGNKYIYMFIIEKMVFL